MSEVLNNVTAESDVNAVKELKDLGMEEAEDGLNAVTKTVENVESKTASAIDLMEEPDDVSFIDVKVCKEFREVPYIGEITGVRMTEEGPLYKVVYRDGDEEEFSTDEVHEGKEKYEILHTSMWNYMIDLVEDLDVEKLKEAGITTISDLELFGGGAAKPTNSGTPFDSLDMPLKTKQQLYITATYLLNDQMLTEDSKMDEMARFNLAKTNGTRRKVRVGYKKKSVVKSVATVKKADKPMARTTMAAKKATEATGKISAPNTKIPSTKIRGRPKVRAGTVPATNYSGPPTDSLDGVSD
jgi:hypothetical protein